MAIFFPPPPPFMGGGQPHAPRKLVPDVTFNNPPFVYAQRLAKFAEITGLSQPAPWRYVFFGAGQPYAPSNIAAIIPPAVITNPPFDSRHTFNMSIVLTTWNLAPLPPPYYPKLKMKPPARVGRSYATIVG